MEARLAHVLADQPALHACVDVCGLVLRRKARSGRLSARGDLDSVAVGGQGACAILRPGYPFPTPSLASTGPSRLRATPAPSPLALPPSRSLAPSRPRFPRYYRYYYYALRSPLRTLPPRRPSPPPPLLEDGCTPSARMNPPSPPPPPPPTPYPHVYALGSPTQPINEHVTPERGAKAPADAARARDRCSGCIGGLCTSRARREQEGDPFFSATPVLSRGDLLDAVLDFNPLHSGVGWLGEMWGLMLDVELC